MRLPQRNDSLVSASIRHWLHSEVGTSPTLGIAYTLNILVTGRLFSAAELPVDLSMSPLEQDLVTGVSAAIVLILVRLILNKAQSPNQQLKRNLSVWVLAATVSVTAPITIESIAQKTLIFNKLWAAICIGFLADFTILMIYTVVIAAYKELRMNSLELAKIRFQVSFINQRLATEIENVRNELKDKVQAEISPVLVAIQEKFVATREVDKPSIESSKALLRSAIDDVVRPLSHEIGFHPIAKDLSFSLNQVQKKITRVPLRDRFLRKVEVSNAFLPSQLFLFIMVFEVGSIVVVGNLKDAVRYGLPATIFTCTAILCFRKLTSHWKIPFVGALIVAILGNISAALSFVLFKQFTVLSLEVVIGLWIGVVLVSTLLSYFGLLVDRRQTVLRDEKSTNTKIAEATAHLRTEIAIFQKRTARMLHGGVQARLQSALLRVRDSTAINQEVIQEVVADVYAAKAMLEKNDFLPILTFGESIDDLIDFWHGVCDITTNLTSNIDERITDHPTINECVIEVVREAVSNAVKHDSARAISINFSQNSSHQMQVEVSHTLENDFQKLNSNSVHGYGSKLFDELTYAWQIEQRGNVIYMRATFVLT